ncbi:MAG: 2-oxoglutarate dehydrogenase complex dihydrolipoyllysine-residue succinyltransferase [Proteobacteria bacterium]|nr:MAG: 2-oxoglutarate dehydrogenase complex dihydrolipoyllysine-residue succinyltransferase [Pseudomonadota bacterium]
MAFEVKFPVVGESVTEGQVYKWRKKAGDFVKRDDVLVEIETDKATVEIVSESEGVLTILKNEGDTVKVGEILGSLDTNASAPTADAAAPKEEAAKASPASAPAPAAQASAASDPRPKSPAVARMSAEENIDTSKIEGSGRDGRVTKGDLIEHKEGGAKPAAAPSAPAPAAAAAPAAPKVAPPAAGERRVRREKMTRIRQRIAERLVEAQHTAAMLTTFNEVDMTAIMELRKKYKDQFAKVNGVNLGFMSFFVKAAVDALKAYPAINGSIDGTDIVYHDYCDIGIAVSTERGLMVPVVKNCENLNFAQIEAAIVEYGKKGREGKIALDDLSGGTFTISNGGTFGSLLSTPILNPPQSAILGMHKIQDRPMAINGQVVIRPMMYLAMSYDHRIVDGKEAVGFLVKIKDAIEDPSRLLLGV